MKVFYEEGASKLVLKRPTDAGYDLSPKCDYVIKPGKNIVPTGIHIQLDYDKEATIRPRSGISANGMPDTSGRTFNANVVLGTIDPGYTGEIGIIVDYNGSVPFSVSKGTRIAQMVISPVVRPEMEEVDSLDESERGNNGFGSSGV